MSRHYVHEGFAFVYPKEWTLEEETHEAGWTVTVQSPGRTAFLVVRLDREMDDADAAARETLATFRSEYPDVEAEAVVEPLAGELAVGYDIEFFTLDTPVTCWTRAFYGISGTVVVLAQCGDSANEDEESVLRGICSTMRLEEED